ncbi:Protein kinase of the Mitotic Exit Network [Coemansia thaxteri]|uniref:Protein kinase of the Mitotic Exit Network n=1 Tax=Coemansia thaxteri TaxID=2663907 RepID=A0A9W8B962_9FUNG|nr:Protein kinase of the Mitotic Exit Network [Coemansia thaxteri]KAJ2004547.1 Protein kinase of the Mitotic Exit Network [Coemansia thaxteri]KAJ2471265.1 Protein kinase of the Mitotic Exit Network [Coemansia sp. RSA 2322]KAJ2481202.1 Protein kinase of the Mitotic Exit Network [Coemansia sp. RSA 2320]
MDDARRIGEYQLGDIIGKGAAGSVYRGLNLRTGGVVAIKQIRKEGFSSYDEIEAARKEIDVLRDLHHRNIVKYIGYEQTEQELDIILEYCEGGSLQNILRKFSKFPENLVGVYVAQILDGLSYLHSNAILHRDIKPGNILLVKEGVVKLADFGVARIQNGLDTVVGSPYWIAPEVLQLKGATSASDIWSLGCTIIQLVDGKAPYQDLPPMAAMFRIGQDEHPPFPSNISPQLRDFLSRCLVHVPSARASADELRQHEWIRACLRERQREGQPHDNYERDIRTVAQWNQVLQNSSPRDVKRFSIGNYGSHMGAAHQVSSYSSSRTRDEIPGAIAGMSSMGISNSNDSTTRRTVSSIAAYEEDSGDDWDNAFENLDALQLKPRAYPSLAYPQSIAAHMSPAIGPRNHSLSITSDAPDAESAGPFLPSSAERAVSDPAANGHSAVSMPYRPHTSPPSPRARPLKKHAISPPEYRHLEHSSGYEDDRSASSNENVYFDNMDYAEGARASGSSVYFASASDIKMEAAGETGSKRPSLGLRQDMAHLSSTQLVPVARSLHQRDTSQDALLETPNASSDHLPALAHQQFQPRQQQQQPLQKQRQSHFRHQRAQESRELFLPGFPSKASEERLRRETEIRWVQDIGTTISSLREAEQEDILIYQCQQVVNLLRDGRGVFAASRDWRVRSIVDAVRAHHASANALKHLLSLVNRLCHMDPRYLRTFCLHGVLPLILPVLQRQHAAHDGSSGELLSEVISFINRLCRSEELAPIHMMLACDGISALCVAIDRLAVLDVAVAAAPLSRVITSLISLLITKAMPAELSASDIGDLLLHARIAPLLSQLLEKYGEACQSPASGRASASGSDIVHSQPTPADRVYHGVCDVLMVVSRLFNELVRRIESLQDHICESDLLASMFTYLHRYPRKAVVLVVHGVRYLSKNPMSLDVLDKAGIFSVSVALLNSLSAHAYREYVMTTVLRLCSSSLERQNQMATTYPLLVSAAMEYAQLKEAPTLSKCGRLIVLGLASGGPQCCRVLKEVDAFELVVKLISRERWCGMAIRALLEWTRTVPSDIVPSLTDEQSADGWGELARPLLSLSTSSTTLDMYAATFYSLVRLYVPLFPRACMGSGEATGACIWVMLMDRYLDCSGLSKRDNAAPRHTVTAEGGMSARPEVVAANHMNATTRLTFLNLLLLLQPHLRLTTPEMRRRISHYYTDMAISSKLDAALPVRKASLELSLALERM